MFKPLTDENYFYILSTDSIEMYAQLLGLFQRRKTRKTDSLEYGEFRNVILKKETNEQTNKTNKLIETDNRFMFARGERRGEEGEMGRGGKMYGDRWKLEFWW